jgi:xanthine dehydrogenase YagS FAD-binding subunit
MNPFQLLSPVSPAAAVAAAGDPGTAFIAGGTDLLQLMKEQVSAPSTLVDLSGSSDMKEVSVQPRGLRLGAMATMAEVAMHPEVVRAYPVLSEALLASASPQVRNMATLGGNLLQRTRCPYFRDVGFAECNKRSPGSGCAAVSGDNRNLAILGGSERCIATNPSDLAVALVALNASVLTLARGGGRRIAVQDLHRLPRRSPQVDTVLQAGELITSLEVPASRAALRSRYLKVRDRASFEFAVVSAAVAIDIVDDIIRDIRLAAGGVGTKPWRLGAVEARLRGRRFDPAIVRDAASLSARGAQPQKHNRFKMELLANTVERAILLSAREIRT